MNKAVNTVFNEQMVIAKINTNKLRLFFVLTSKPPPRYIYPPRAETLRNCTSPCISDYSQGE
jgi:hypothetical protein